MSGKTIISGLLLVAAIAVNVIPGVGQAASAALLSIGVSVSAAVAVAGIDLALALGSSLLLGPGRQSLPNATSPVARLSVSMDPTTPRKFVFGDTAGATDLRYQTFSGTDQEYYHQVIAVASHKVNSIYEIWLDNELAWSSASGITTKFSSYLTVNTITEGATGAGFAVDTVWTTSSSMTGCAQVWLKYKLTGASDSEDSPFAGGVTTRMTIRTQGALIYDPRLDSTVSGGSGSQRAATQSTWAWSSSASRNPALQLLWYLLGWKINGKLAVGMGLPSARLDLPSFITAANACDESVTLNGGGTEPRYRGDGVLSESDDRRAVIDTLCQTMNATLRDAGGKLSLTVLKDDLASPIASFSEDDILGDEEWAQSVDLHQTFNITRGQRVDSSNTALYQLVDFAEVSLTSLDGIDRIDTVQYPLVQSNGQAIRLAKQRLERNQYQGRYSFTGGPRYWRTSIGDIVQQSHAGLGWTNKLFRVAGQAISRTGETRMVLVEENAAIYAWDNSEAAAVTPGAPTIYDPANHPIIVGINERQTSTGNLLTDILFSRKWTLGTGSVRAKANANSGYAQGDARYYLELTPNALTQVDDYSEKVRVTAGQRYFCAIRAQRGTTLGTGSRLNLGGRWLGSDGATVIATGAEATQQTPSSLTAGAKPLELTWNEVAPANAYYYQMHIYTPALASSSGTFRVEAPKVTRNELGADVSGSITGATPVEIDYQSDGTTTTQLPKTVSLSFMVYGVNVAASATWTTSVTAINGTCSASVSNTAGTKGQVTLSSLSTNSATVRVFATYNGTPRQFDLTVSKNIAQVNVGTGGSNSGATGVDSSFANATSTTSGSPTVISDEITVTMTSGVTTAKCIAALTFYGTPSNPANSSTLQVQAKAQWWNGTAWVDLGAGYTAGSPSYSYAIDADGFVTETYGAINFTVTKTGLTAGSSYKFRLVAYISSSLRITGPTASETGTFTVKGDGS